MLEVKIKKLDYHAVIPTYSKEGDAGMDLTAIEIEITEDYIEYGTGLAVEIPYGYVGLLFPRSSVSKKDLLLCNSVGVVDAGYRGEIKLRFKITEDNIDNIYDVGERVGQIVIMPFPEIKFLESATLSDSVRGTNGYGSTNV